MTAADVERIALHRRFYADLVTAPARTSLPGLWNAFMHTPREAFLGPGPWEVFTGGTYIRTPSDDPAFVYQDVLVRLKGDVNNGQPMLHAACLAALAIAPGQVVIRVGAGSGYYTAILAKLAGPSGHVHAYEVDDDLAGRARRNLGGQPNVSVHGVSAIGGSLPEADVVYVNAGVSFPPAEWLDALCRGGRLLFPLTPAAGPGAMLLVTRTAGSCFDARFIAAAMFIPCSGGRTNASATAVGDAFRRGDAARVRSLRRSGDPDASSWCAGDGWWLSTEGCPATGPGRFTGTVPVTEGTVPC
jgi:protein-L-isoaspartate(D-aspartate) O-methyltransferase